MKMAEGAYYLNLNGVKQGPLRTYSQYHAVLVLQVYVSS